MLDHRGDQVGGRTSGFSLRAQHLLHDAGNRGVVGLGATAGEHDFGRTRPDQCGDGFARAFDGLPASLAELVRGAGIAEFGPEIRQHGLEHRGVHWRSGVMIEIDALHFALSYEVAP